MENQQNINKESAETPLEEETLGIKNPLLTPTTLGQNFLSLQSISPLGSRSINLINWSLISPNQTLLQSFQDHENWQDSSISEFRPFTPNLLTENSPVIQPPSDKTVPPSIPIQLSSELPIQQQTENPSSDSELPIQQQIETASSDSELPIQPQTETIFPFRTDQKTRKNSITQNSKSSTSHFFQKKSEFPREKIAQEPVNKLSKKPIENQEISTTEESVINSTEADSLPEINPTDIATPEIPNYSPLQKQSDSTINPTESSDFTDIITPKISNCTPLQKQSDFTINPTESSDSTDIVTPKISNYTPLQKQSDSTVDNIPKTESTSTINPTDIINPEISNYTPLQKQPDSTINPTESSDSMDIATPEIPTYTPLQKQPDSTINPT
ncbi:hypothetical protein, partial [Planktothrix paucivesiculata]|uniref:hypothetical protein n=1 Tax=Planktothrix paucivesiculata TaxID=1678308 RepID=UPI0018CBFEF9